MSNEYEKYYAINRESGAQIFEAHNGENTVEALVKKWGWDEIVMGRGVPIDFHGLQVAEVEQYMNRIISFARSLPNKVRITIITGSGNHSYAFLLQCSI